MLDKETLEQIVKGIPQSEYKKTLLYNIGHANDENLISDFYAYFFRKYPLFIDIILKLVDASDLINTGQDYKVYREYTLITDERIDILIVQGDKSVIIENKIEEKKPKNNFENYWRYSPGKQKKGILLTKYNVGNKEGKIEKENEKFLFSNIIHKQYCEEILKHKDEIKDAFDKLLAENTCYTLIYKAMTKEELKYFIDNKKEIAKVQKFIFDIKRHVLEEVKKVPELIGLDLEVTSWKGLAFDQAKDQHFIQLKYNKHLMFTIAFGKEFISEDEENIFYIIIELNQRINLESFKEIVLNNKYKDIKNENYFQDKPEKLDAIHIARKEYRYNADFLENFGENIAKKIKEDGFLDFFNDIAEKFNT